MMSSHFSFLSRNTLALLAAVAFAAAATEAHAQIYTESGDAGQTLAGTQATGLNAGTTLLRINGTFGSLQDADVYSFTVSAATTLRFSTVNATTTADTELFLFTNAGNALVANDDASGVSFGSTFTFTLAPGTYRIGVSITSNEPVDSTNQLLFAAGTTPTEIRGPNSSAGPLANFNSGAFDDGSTFPAAYGIDIAVVVPEPSSVVATAVLGALAGVGAWRRKRRG